METKTIENRIEAQGAPANISAAFLWVLAAIVAAIIAIFIDRALFNAALEPFFDGSGVRSAAQIEPAVLERTMRVYGVTLFAAGAASFLFLRSSVAFPAIALWFALGAFCFAADFIMGRSIDATPLIASIFEILSYVCAMAFVAGLFGAGWLAATDPARPYSARVRALIASAAVAMLFYVFSISFRIGGYLVSTEFSGMFLAFSSCFLLILGISLGNFMFALFVMVAPFIPLWNERPQGAKELRGAS